MMSWWSAAFSALGSALGSSSQRRQSDRESRRTLEQRRQEQLYDAQAQRAAAMWERGNELEDRRYRQEAMGSYAQFNRTPGIVSPEYSSTTPTNMELPAWPEPAKPTKPRKKSLLGG